MSNLDAERYVRSRIEARRHRRIIGLVGEIGHGKSSVAKMIYALPDGVQRVGWHAMSFAAPLKALCATTSAELGVPASAFYGTQAEKAAPQPALGGASGRDLLQKVGTDGFRATYPRFWVDLALLRAREAADQGYGVVFEDVRFLDEAEAIRAAGGQIWRVVKTDTRPAWRRAVSRIGRLFAREHASETEARRVVADETIEAAPGDMASLRLMTDYLLSQKRFASKENR